MLVFTYVRLSPVFLGICPLVYSEILHSDRNIETENSDRSGFFRKNLVCPKLGKKDLKWSFF